jgi:hypothetical protein
MPAFYLLRSLNHITASDMNRLIVGRKTINTNAHKGTVNGMPCWFTYYLNRFLPHAHRAASPTIIEGPGAGT